MPQTAAVKAVPPPLPAEAKAKEPIRLAQPVAPAARDGARAVAAPRHERVQAARGGGSVRHPGVPEAGGHRAEGVAAPIGVAWRGSSRVARGQAVEVDGRRQPAHAHALRAAARSTGATRRTGSSSPCGRPRTPGARPRRPPSRSAAATIRMPQRRLNSSRVPQSRKTPSSRRNAVGRARDEADRIVLEPARPDVVAQPAGGQLERQLEPERRARRAASSAPPSRGRSAARDPTRRASSPRARRFAPSSQAAGVGRAEERGGGLRQVGEVAVLEAGVAARARRRARTRPAGPARGRARRSRRMTCRRPRAPRGARACRAAPPPRATTSSAT